MGFFEDKKKGNESLKTLSEKEIQSKLYGHIRNNDRIVQDDLPVTSKPRQESQSFHKSAEVSAKTAAVSTKASAPDLFNKTQEYPTELLPSSKRFQEDITPKKQELKSSVTNKIHSEKSKKLVTAKSVLLFQAIRRILEALGRVIKEFLFKIAQILGVAVSAVIRGAASIDFKKPAVRRFFYTVAAGALLGFVFVGIHHLNKNREAAMKAPHKNSVEHVKKTKSKHPAEALESALSAESIETGNASAMEHTNSNPKTEVKESNVANKTELPNKSAMPLSRGHLKTSEEKRTNRASAATSSKSEVKSPIAATETAASDTPSYVIQVATYATPEDAGKLVEKFKMDGFNSFFKSVSRSGGRMYYCIFIGKFSSHQEADSKLAEFKKKDIAKPFQDAFVRSV